MRFLFLLMLVSCASKPDYDFIHEHDEEDLQTLLKELKVKRG